MAASHLSSLNLQFTPNSLNYNFNIMGTPAAKHTMSQTPKIVATTTPVSTPYSATRSLNLSPQHVKKSPAATALSTQTQTQTQAHNSFTSAPLNFDSPSAQAAFAMVDIGFDGTAGIAAGLAAAPPNADELKAEKFQTILEILGQVKGKVSEDGIERLGRKIGMDCFWENGIGSNPTKVLIMAGTGISVDIDCTGGTVQSVTLNFVEVPEEVQAEAVTAGNIMKRDLLRSGPKGDGMERFDRNLRRLYAYDKLSVPGFNCFEAVVGLFAGLKRLYEHEHKEVMSIPNLSPGKVDKQMVCSKSGKPRMHAHETIGLSIDYWRAIESNVEKIWSLIIECEACPSESYPPARISKDWIAKSVIKTSGVETTKWEIDWQEPKNTEIKPKKDDSQKDAMQGIEAQGSKFPDVRFVAKFSPAVIVPYLVGEYLHHAVGVEYRPNQMGINSYDEHFSPTGETSTRDNGVPSDDTAMDDELKQFYAYRCIRSSNPHETYDPLLDVKVTSTHSTAIYFKKVEYAMVLTELPFNHPRQIIELLPHLRKWAQLGSLLRNLMHNTSKPSALAKEEKKEDDFDSDSDEDDDKLVFKHGKTPSNPDEDLEIQVLTTPEPMIEVHFMLGGTKIEACLEITLNGKIEVRNSNIDKSSLKIEMLESCGDLEMWVRYLRMISAKKA